MVYWWVPPLLYLSLLLIRPAVGITIVPTYDPTGAGSIHPSFDQNAAQLIPIFDAAAKFYEDVFEDLDHTLTIDFWYSDLTILGDHDLIDQNGGRETDADIQIDTNAVPESGSFCLLGWGFGGILVCRRRNYVLHSVFV